ncbi:hypothetical protein GCM10023339_23740 [Alloalcanivorax gelatiniphagus]
MTWSRRRFVVSGLAAVLGLITIRWVLLGLTSSTAARALLLAVYLLGGLFLFYMTFSWAKEHDRRHPRG